MKVRVTLLNIVVASLAMWALVDIVQYPPVPATAKAIDLMAWMGGLLVSA